jgi:hypothetical protein
MDLNCSEFGSKLQGSRIKAAGNLDLNCMGFGTQLWATKDLNCRKC